MDILKHIASFANLQFSSFSDLMKMELKILMKTGVQKYSLGQDKTSLDSVILLVNGKLVCK